MSTTNLYDETVKKELEVWQQKLLKRANRITYLSKNVQGKIQNLVPEKVQNTITVAMKGMIETVLTASSVFTETEVATNPALSESDFLVERMYKTYYKIAMAQGVGFGMGGMLINLADLPALLSTKVKFLFDCAKLYGFDVNEKSERLFILYVFQLAFCSDEHKEKIVPIVMNWEAHKEHVKLNWRQLQIEYRDYMDIAKLLQLLPVVGAAAGGFANHHLMQKLKETAMNSYRWRIVTTKYVDEEGDGDA
ncbi:MAG: EcsC family protein [Defluviitaleaceae bacterium]|nr:EcsC family protein [Defluviitaleaceae bacterium]